ncbi:MAG: AMP-binding protein, partial [Acidimicrobiales bacterium]
MDTFTQRIESAAATGRGDIVFLQGDEAVRVSWAQLHEEAKAMAAALQDRGVTAGDHVAIIGPTTRSLVTALQATWLAGAATVVLPLPMRLSSIDEFIQQTRVRLRASESAITLIDADLAGFITPQPADPPMVGFGEIEADAGQLGAEAFRRPEDDPDRLAILQFTSGSTDSPKGVTVLQRNLVANLDAIQERT